MSTNRYPFLTKETPDDSKLWLTVNFDTNLVYPETIWVRLTELSEISGNTELFHTLKINISGQKSQSMAQKDIFKASLKPTKTMTLLVQDHVFLDNEQGPTPLPSESDSV